MLSVRKFGVHAFLVSALILLFASSDRALHLIVTPVLNGVTVERIATIPSIPSNGGLKYLAHDTQGNFWVAPVLADSPLLRVTPEGVISNFPGVLPGSDWMFTGVAVASSEEIVAVRHRTNLTNAVTIFTSAGAYVRSDTLVQSRVDLAVDSAGTVYTLAEQTGVGGSRDSIHRIRAAGGVILTGTQTYIRLSTNDNAQLNDLALDRNGNLYTVTVHTVAAPYANGSVLKLPAGTDTPVLLFNAFGVFGDPAGAINDIRGLVVDDVGFAGLTPGLIFYDKPHRQIRRASLDGTETCVIATVDIALFENMDFDFDLQGRLVAVLGNEIYRFCRPAPAPRPVSELKGTYLGGGQVKLTWKPSPDSTGIRYRVYTDSGTGTINYDTALASLLKTAGETMIAQTLTGIPTDTFVLFAVRVADTCGRAETQAPVVGVATIAAGSNPFASCIEIKAPHAGRKVDGNRLNIVADVCTPEGANSDRRRAVASIRFDFRAAGGGAWTPIPPADSSFPNPDTTRPWFTHWDVTGLVAGAYDIRAMGTDTAGTVDSFPPVIQVFVAHSSWEVRDTVVGGRARHEASVQPGVATEVSQAGRDGSSGSGRSVTTRIEIPAGLRSQTDTVVVEVLDSDSTILASGFPGRASSIGEYREISWASGATNFGDSTVDIILSYPDDDGDGIVDATSLAATSLSMYYRDGSSWIPVTTVSVDTASREVRGRSNHFTAFGLGGGSEGGSLGLFGTGTSCLIARTQAPSFLLGLSRSLRDLVLWVPGARLLIEVYYAIG